MRISIIIIAVLLFVAAIAATADSPLTPVVKNAGFEEVTADNQAPGWGWNCNVQASFKSETENPHSGSRCIAFNNVTPGMVWNYAQLYQDISVLPGTDYEFTAWVRGEDVLPDTHISDGIANVASIPNGTFGWTKVSGIWHTKQNQTNIRININLFNKCKTLAVDDISIRPIGNPIKGKSVSGFYMVPGRVDADDQKAYLGIRLDSKLKSAATVKASVKAGKETLFEKSAKVTPGENTIEWEWSSGKTFSRSLQLQIRVLDEKGKLLASSDKKLEKLSPAITKAELDKCEARFKGEFTTLYNKCQTKGIPLDYPTVTKTTLEQFIPFTREDLEKNEALRADYCVIDFKRSINRSIKEMKAYLADPKLVPNARRYQTSKVEIDGLSFIGDRKDSTGKKDRGPVFLVGYGHFPQTRKDMPRWPGYGINIIQSAEFGPNEVLLNENEINQKFLDEIIKAFDEAAKNNVKVDLLLSPHYFPHWARAKWPQINRGGFYFSPDIPETKYVIRKFLEIVIPQFKDKPALHSFCLTNEPTFMNPNGCDNTRDLWTTYLTERYGDIKLLNEKYGTNHAAFSDVPFSGMCNYEENSFHDWCIFNQERLAQWHKWMADIIHEMAPNVPTHSKIMGLVHFHQSQSGWGVDPELFGRYLDINGNDCASWPTGKPWAIDWWEQNLWYDLQRSLNYKPIFNSENHLTGDGSTDYYNPYMFRESIWQGAIHGQSATTFWVWERTYDRGYPFYGNIMHRAGCAEEVGLTTLDLNRFAEEVTALQNVKSPVAILYSMSSLCKTRKYEDAVRQAHTALNFCGVKVDFISEKQLLSGKGKDYKMIVLAGAENVHTSTIDALEKLPKSTRLAMLGDSLAKDQYNKPYPAARISRIRKNALIIDPKGETDLLWPVASIWPTFVKELDRLGAMSDFRVVDAATGKPVWGVEWLPAKVKNRTVINMVNLLADKPIKVKILSRGKTIQANDLLSLGGQEKVSVLQPLVPVLAELK